MLQLQKLLHVTVHICRRMRPTSTVWQSCRSEEFSSQNEPEQFVNRLETPGIIRYLAYSQS